MTVINVQKLKNQYKAALKSGKIVYVDLKFAILTWILVIT